MLSYQIGKNAFSTLSFLKYISLFPSHPTFTHYSFSISLAFKISKSFLSFPIFYIKVKNKSQYYPS